MTTTAGSSDSDGSASLELPIIWIHPRGWNVDNASRRFIPFSERNHGEATELGILRRSVELLLARQDQRGSFYSDEEYRLGDKVDDQLGGAAALAYYLERTGPEPALSAALDRAVQFHIHHLVHRCPDKPFRYSRYVNDRDTSNDLCNTLWCLWGGSLVLRHGTPYLSGQTSEDLRGVLADYWGLFSNSAIFDENPCHNQLLAYCEIGILYAQTVGRKEIVTQLLDYFHGFMRPMRIHDRGHWIYSEFNRWDCHYGVLSWIMLEHLFAATGDPACGEDADAMALYFNEQVSAGGYCWGGSRNNESGLEEFPHLFASRAEEFGLDRLLFPEPSNLWKRLAMDGHNTKILVTRMEVALPQRGPARSLPPTPWHFRRGNASACLLDDTRLHHVSSAGLEIIPAASAVESTTPTLRWYSKGAWREDALVSSPPPSSATLRFHDSRPIELAGAAGVTSMQRGYTWEIRQWWLGFDTSLLWVGQLISHAFPQCDMVDFVLGTPVLTRLAGRPVPVTEVETAEGARAATQGDPASVSSARYLRFGDVFIGGTAPLEFVRPSAEAFHTFPTPGRMWRDFASSNEVRVRVLDSPRTLECRESLFFAVEIGERAPALNVSQESFSWVVRSASGTFLAVQNEGVWSYALETASGRESLPGAAFGPSVKSGRQP